MRVRASQTTKFDKGPVDHGKDAERPRFAVKTPKRYNINREDGWAS
jgi:hypothetical protein